MTDHPMFLEYDWTSNTYRSHLCGAGTSVAHSFETLAASRHALHLIGLRIGDKTDERTWRIEFMEPVAERGSPVKAKGRQRAAVARLRPARPGGLRAALILPVARERRLKSLAAAPRSDLPSWAPASRW